MQLLLVDDMYRAHIDVPHTITSVGLERIQYVKSIDCFPFMYRSYNDITLKRYLSTSLFSFFCFFFSFLLFLFLLATSFECDTGT